MVIDIETNGAITNATKNKVVKSVDHTNNVVTLTANLSSVQGKDSIVYVQGSRSNELTGLESLFGTSSTLYGLTRCRLQLLSWFLSFPKEIGFPFFTFYQADNGAPVHPYN